MNPLRQAVIDRVWRGKDPLQNLPPNFIELDVQNWNSQHPYLQEAVLANPSSLVIEIGVWKGGSTIFMADQMRQARQPSVVIAIDTWLGSSEHWIANSFYDSMSFMNGYPVNYHKFASNVLRTGLADWVVPLPLDSINAALYMNFCRVVPDLIHLDGAHDYDSVSADLKNWWPLLRPGGVLIGDDYATDGTWESVRRAFDDFFGALRYPALEHSNHKCRVVKTAG